MRRLPALVLVLLLACAACTSGSGDGTARPTPSSSSATTAKDVPITFGSLDIDWPVVTGDVTWAARPTAPAGFDDALLARMEKTLTTWGAAAATDATVWHSTDAVGDVADALPRSVASKLKAQVKDAVSPRLGVANVFAKDVKVVGAPRLTSAWKISTAENDAGRPYVSLELQTRTAYEVSMSGGATRVVGMLRVQGLSAFADTTDNFGVSGGWQEFGAGDCTLALDDDLVPDADADDARKDLRTFVRVGSGTRLEMPRLGTDEQVDPEYLQRCRDGSV